ncbi:MAG: glutamyl-tRNA reductase [Candidatus Melainabacteria bacterium]|nr:glutamyl-tRNA reductase [Candidatus Melainabacteria bacterium]
MTIHHTRAAEANAMHLVVAGLRYKTATIDIREQVAFSESEVAQALPRIRLLPGVRECALLTTCNRTECYMVCDDPLLAVQSLKLFLSQDKGFDVQRHRRAFFTLMYEDAVLHLFRVASGLDSLILGEGQILAQVKEAWQLAQRSKTQGILLDRLFQCAVTVGKRVRSETGIAQRDASVSQAALSFVMQRLPNFHQQTIAVIGGGKMAEILLEELICQLSPPQKEQLMLVNRSEARLQELTAKYGVRGAGWAEIDAVLAKATVVFVATGAPHIILSAARLQQAGVCTREESPLTIVDISVPRNVEPEAAHLPGVQLYNTDSLAELDQGLDALSAGLPPGTLLHVDRILEEEYKAFHHWQIGQPARDAITRLRAKVEDIRQHEAASYTDAGTCPPSISGYDQLIEQVSRSLVNKILHEPTVRLKETGRYPEEVQHYAAFLAYLFDAEAQQPLPRRLPLLQVRLN